MAWAGPPNRQHFWVLGVRPERRKGVRSTLEEGCADVASAPPGWRSARCGEQSTEAWVPRIPPRIRPC